jgi:hypothetical protein
VKVLRLGKGRLYSWAKKKPGISPGLEDDLADVKAFFDVSLYHHCDRSALIDPVF